MKKTYPLMLITMFLFSCGVKKTIIQSEKLIEKNTQESLKHQTSEQKNYLEISEELFVDITTEIYDEDFINDFQCFESKTAPKKRVEKKTMHVKKIAQKAESETKNVSQELKNTTEKEAFTETKKEKKSFNNNFYWLVFWFGFALGIAIVILLKKLFKSIKIPFNLLK